MTVGGAKLSSVLLCRVISLPSPIIISYFLLPQTTGGLILKYVPFLTPTKLLINLHRGTFIIPFLTENVELKLILTLEKRFILNLYLNDVQCLTEDGLDKTLNKQILYPSYRYIEIN